MYSKRYAENIKQLSHIICTYEADSVSPITCHATDELHLGKFLFLEFSIGASAYDKDVAFVNIILLKQLFRFLFYLKWSIYIKSAHNLSDVMIYCRRLHSTNQSIQSQRVSFSSGDCMTD